VISTTFKAAWKAVIYTFIHTPKVQGSHTTFLKITRNGIVCFGRVTVISLLSSPGSCASGTGISSPTSFWDYSLPDFCLQLYSELIGAGSVCLRCWLIAEVGTAAAKVSGGEN